MTVRVRSNVISSPYLDPRPSIATRRSVRMTKGIAKLDPHKEFYVLVANFSQKGSLTETHLRWIRKSQSPCFNYPCTRDRYAIRTDSAIC